MKPSVNNVFKINSGRSVVENLITGSRLTFNTIINENYFEDCSKFSQSQLESLIKGGFIVEDSLDEVDQRIRLYQNIQNDSSRRTLHLIPSFRCNMDCPYCFEKGYNTCEDVSNYFSVLEKYIKRENGRFEKLHISFFGGEPLLCWEKICSFLNHLDKYSFDYITSITTNGVLLTDDIIKTLIEHNCEYYQVTLEGSISRHNSMRSLRDGSKTFETIINNIEKILSYNQNKDFVLKIRINVLDESPNEIEEILDSIDISFRNKIVIDFKRIFKTEHFEYNTIADPFRFSEFNDLAKNMGYQCSAPHSYFNPCEAGRNLNDFYLTPDLHIWKCVNNMKITVSELGVMLSDGNICWDEKKVDNWKKYSDITSFNKECITCNHFIRCAGGCIIHRILNGSVKCNTYKQNYE